MPGEIAWGRRQEVGREAVSPSVHSLILLLVLSALYLEGKKAAVADPKLPSWLFSQTWPWKFAVDIFIWPMVHLLSPL